MAPQSGDETYRWLGLAGVILIESVSGSAYGFSVYSPQLKAALNYTQSEVNSISSIGNVGSYLTIVPGVFFDAFGPRATAIGGALLTALGYGLLWASLTRRIAASPGLCALWVALAWHGSGWLDTASVALTVGNFRANKGVVLGLIKSLFGLSGALLALVYVSIFKPNSDAFLLSLVLIVPAFVLPAVPLLRVVPAALGVRALYPRERARVGVGYLCVGALACALVLVSTLQDHGSLVPSPAYAAALVPAVMLLAGIIMPQTWALCGRTTGPGEHSEELSKATEAAEEEEAPSAALLPEAPDEEGESGPKGASFWEGVLNWDFLLIAVMLFSATGAVSGAEIEAALCALMHLTHTHRTLAVPHHTHTHRAW